MNRQTFRILLIGLGSILLIFAINIADKTETLPTKPLADQQNSIKPSAYLTNSTFNIFNTEGKLSTLHAEKAFFYKDQDAIEIDSPTFSTDDQNTNIVLTAKNGIFHPTDESLVLKGDVIARQTEGQSTVWQLTTNELNIDNKAGMLFTNDTVNVTSGFNSLNATGISVSMNDKKIKLLSKVRGKYVFD